MAIGQQTSAPEGSTTEQARQKAQDVKQQAQHQAQKAAVQARERMRTQVDQRSTQAGEQVAGQAGDLRTVADQLREQGKDRPAQLADRAAQQTERVASYLRDSDADRMLGDAEDVARSNPWAVVAGGIALGFAASRFLKASSSERYQQSEHYQLQSPSWREPAVAHGALPPTEATPTVGPGEGYAPPIPDRGDVPGRRAGTDW